MTIHARACQLLVLVVLFTVTTAAISAEPRHPLTLNDLLSLPRVSDVQLAPDGNAVAYTVATPNVTTNDTETNLWVVDTKQGNARQLTFSGRDRAARWSPDGRRIAFLSRRDGKAQVYMLSLDGGEARAVTHMPVDVETLRWAPNGSTLVLSAVVDPDCRDDECLRTSAERRAAGKAVRLYDHWPVHSAMQWVDGFRSHVFAVAADGSSVPRDLTPGRDFDVPSRTSIDNSVDAADIAVSADSSQICFSAASGREPDGQSFLQLFVVPLEGGTPRQITQGATSNRAPAYSPDGSFIAYRSQLNAKNFAGGRWGLMIQSTASGAGADRTAGFDRSVSAFAWASRGAVLYFSAENETQSPLYAVSAGKGTGPKLLADGFVGELSSAASGKAVAFARSTLSAPAEIFFLADDRAKPRQLTHHDAQLNSVALSTVERFWFKSKDSTSIQAMYLPPTGLDAKRKYPLLVLLHGGPETAWGDSWGYRWNPQVFTAAGYGVLMINRRGSTGYGQKFTEAVRLQWGGTPYEDIMAGTDEALRRYGYLDGDRVAAAGASYGGYMANWLATHTGRFKTIVSHSGVFNLTSMYATDIHSFLEFEQGGTPWGAADSFAKWSPSTYAPALGTFKTPMLVTTGDRDFRVPYFQSLELYATLQRQGVESRLLVFPDEGHWILKPQNAKLWYTTVIDWVNRYTPAPGAP
jgi:dipeptidyl aminopeptidase/acylaminoacyl peptidase